MMNLLKPFIPMVVLIAVGYLFLSSGYGVGKFFLSKIENPHLSFWLMMGGIFVAGIGASIK